MIYVDTSFLAPLYIKEATSTQVEATLRSQPPRQISISDWTQVEFASLVSRRVRMRELESEQVTRIFRTFEADCADTYTVLPVSSSDFQLATALLWRDQTTLRAGDALHLAIARNRQVPEFLTLDKALTSTAQAFGLAVSNGGTDL
ncbi:type II toxin-antitoxin system VapC family toxin [Halomicronema sp. CCY15110]|uniref:type II toxin-antitoxin system VapC family toxin n=1 Tax=Halomicronema sp. CCY15110 TaxID=2767773 RepID=UPI00194F4314|nr:type II toxin-antitoxin system VapC family toxin [Halomicronema sp. CCY15110]